MSTSLTSKQDHAYLSSSSLPSSSKLGALYKKWQGLLEGGHFYKGQEAAKEYLSALYERRQATLGLSFLEELKTREVDLDIIVEYEILFHHLRKNYSAIDSLLKSYKIASDKDFADFVFQIFEKYDLSFDHISELCEMGLKKSFDSFKKKLDESQSKDKDKEKTKLHFASEAYGIVALAFEILLEFDRDLNVLEILSEYAVLFERKRLLMSLNVFCMRNVHLFEGNKKLLWKLQGKFSLISNFRDDAPQEKLKQEIDFGTDLFQEENLDEKGRLERDIVFLQKRGKQVDVLLKKLASLDPENTLLFLSDKNQDMQNKTDFLYERGESDKCGRRGEEEESLEKARKSDRESFGRKAIDKSEEEILDLLGKYLTFSESQVSEDKNLSEKALEKNLDERELASSYLNVFSEEELHAHYPDLVISLLGMNLYKASKIVLENLNLFESVQFLYLWCVTNFSLCDFDEGIRLIEDFLKKDDLGSDDFVCFSYLLAEALRQKGKTQEAIAAYMAVAKIDKDYRLVTDRLSELEKL